LQVPERPQEHENQTTQEDNSDTVFISVHGSAPSSTAGSKDDGDFVPAIDMTGFAGWRGTAKKFRNIVRFTL
jgi:hypothetical protein